MRPFRSRVMTAILGAILLLGMLGSAAQAFEPTEWIDVPEDPPPSLI
jgi:hypothetical protein